MKMKNGRTHLAHKQEHAVDMETGAIVAVTIAGGTAHDTRTVEKTIEEADNNLGEVRERANDKSAKRVSHRVRELVVDNGYHSNAVLMALEEIEIRSYVSEPDRGRRRWKNKLRTSQRSAPRSMPTGVESVAIAARRCCANGASCSSAPSLTHSRPEACAALICATTTTSSSDSSCTSRASTSVS